MQKKITNSFGVVALSLFPLQSPELSKGFAVCFLSLPSYDYLLYYNPVNIPLFIHPVNIYSGENMGRAHTKNIIVVDRDV